MKRERPEYLQPIPRSRWEFPWLALWAVLLLGMAAGGIWLHMRTGDAWSERFETPAPVPAQVTTRDQAQAAIHPDKEAAIAHIRILRERAGREAEKARADVRCIDGVPFRRIPGGWENVPGETCP